MKKAFGIGALIVVFSVAAIVSVMYIFDDYIFFQEREYEPSEAVLMIGEAFETGDEYDRDEFGAIGDEEAVEKIASIGEGGITVFIHEDEEEILITGNVNDNFVLIYMFYSESMMRNHITLYGEIIMTPHYGLEMWGRDFGDDGHNTEMTIDEVKEKLQDLTLEDVAWLVEKWE